MFPRWRDPSGSDIIVAALFGAVGAALAFTVGSEAWGAIGATAFGVGIGVVGRGWLMSLACSLVGHGHTKHNRGIRRFHRRGRSAVRTEWRLLMATHNLIKLHSAQLAAAAA